MQVDDDGKMLSKFPMIFLPPGASEQEFSEESVVHLCNIGGTHWRLLWPQLGLQETVLDEDMDEDLQQVREIAQLRWQFQIAHRLCA